MRRSAMAVSMAALLALATVAAPVSAAGGSSPCQGRIGTFGTLAVPPGGWSIGTHSYTATIFWTPVDPEDPGSWTTDPVTFTVSAAAPLRPGPVFLRMFGLSATPGPFTPIGDVINPAQATVFYAGVFLWPGDYTTIREGRLSLEGVAFAYAWDDRNPVEAHQTPIIDTCGSGVVEKGDTVQLGGGVHRHYAG